MGESRRRGGQGAVMRMRTHYGAVLLLTKREIVQQLKVSERTVERLEAQGVIRAVRFGRSVRYSQCEVERIIGARLAS